MQAAYSIQNGSRMNSERESIPLKLVHWLSHQSWGSEKSGEKRRLEIIVLSGHRASMGAKTDFVHRAVGSSTYITTPTVARTPGQQPPFCSVWSALPPIPTYQDGPAGARSASLTAANSWRLFSVAWLLCMHYFTEEEDLKLKQTNTLTVNKKKCISSHVKIKSLLWDQELMNFLTALSPVETGSRGRSQTKLVCTFLMLLRWWAGVRTSPRTQNRGEAS